jgi:hypothetical protein
MKTPICEKFQEKEDSAIRILCDCDTIACLRFRHIGHPFMEPSDIMTPIPHKESPTLY